HTADFRVPDLLAERGYCVVIHHKFLPLPVNVPRTVTPLHIHAKPCRREFPRRRLTREKESIHAIEGWAAKARGAYSKALPERVANASRPVAILVFIEDAPRIHRR